MKGSFEEELLACIDDVLSSLGPNIKNVVIFYLERKGIKFREIPKNPERFSEFLKEIYGGAASVIEKMIIRCLASKKGLDISYIDFSSTLAEIKMKWEA